MHTIPKLLFATAIIAIGSTISTLSVQAFSFNSNTGALNDSPISNTATPTEFTFNVTGVTTSAGYSYSLTINLTHANLTELEGYLINNTSGRTLNLFSTLSGSNLVSTTFIDGQPLISSGSAPYTGNFAPENNAFVESPTVVATTFSDFNDSTNPNTTWTLRFYDSFNGNVGNLNNATFDITPVPFEFDGSVGILLVGVSLAVSHWQKKCKGK
jgi:hypothetical protein